MRIISDFHDYYDVGMQNGIDPQLPYRRFRRVEPICFPDTGWGSFGRKIRKYAKNYRFFYIGFAGKIWACMDIAFNEDTPSFCFEPSLIDDSFFIETGKKIGGHWGYKLNREKDIQIAAKEIKEQVIECFEYSSKPEFFDWFEMFKTAVFVFQLGDEKVVINERLSHYSFQKVLPPVQAFQELEMYVGARLTKPVIEEPPIPDKIKAEIHGFDKYSFRKDKRQ